MRKALLALMILAIAALPAAAFHDQGVAHCNGCHTMHNSQDGTQVDPDNAAGNGWLLNDATPSDVCLNCHATRSGAVFADDVLNPAPLKGAGNFIFLLEDNIDDGYGGGATSDMNGDGVVDDDEWTDPVTGDAAGHNIVAPGHELAADGTLTTSPGGSFNAANLSCTSCHDPHGNDNFRMLYGAGAVVQDGLYTYNTNGHAPAAEGLGLHFGSESQTSHTAYQGGMSAWCGNCHGDFHTGATSLVHPSGSGMGGGAAQTYNAYNGTDDQTGGVQATAYLAEVPFDDAANTTTSTAGPTGGSQVMCLTCHRAHASSAMDAGRWDFNVTLLHEDGVESGSYAIPDPYDSVNQRSLCNKCHNKDEGDHIATP